MTELETRLRDELNAAARDVRTSPDAWQRNLERVAADRSARPRKRAAWVLSAAAVVLGVVTASSIVLGGGDGPTGPAKGANDDPFSRSHVLGPTAVVEDLTLDGEGAVHEMALTDLYGKGPSLCDRIVGTSSSSGSCTARDPAADTEQVAFDWLSGPEGDGSLRGVIGGVDSRVASVAIWMTNGERVDAELQPGDAVGNKLFGYAVPTTVEDSLGFIHESPTPMRLAAYNADGEAVEYVNLATRFGTEWVVADGSVKGCEPIDGCLIEKLDPRMLAQIVREKYRVVVVVWPDVKTIRLVAGDGTETREFVPNSPGLLVIREQFDEYFFGGRIPDDLTLIVTDDGANSETRRVPAAK